MRRTLLLLLVVPIGCAKPVAPAGPAAPVTVPGAPADVTTTTPGGWTVTKSFGPKETGVGGQLAIAGGSAPEVAPAGPTRPDFNGEPLPAGAVARLDSAARKLDGGWNGAFLTPDGLTLLFAPYSDNAIVRYDPVTLKPLGQPVRADVERDLGSGRPSVSSRDGSRCNSAGGGWADVFEAATGKRLLRFPSNPKGHDLSLSADGKRAAFATAFRETPGHTPLVCAVWDVDAGKEVGKVAVAQNGVTRCRLSPDGLTLMTWGTHGNQYAEPLPGSPALVTQIWDVATFKELARADWPFGPLAFSPDSKLVAVGVAGVAAPGIVLADARSGKVVTTLKADPALAALTGPPAPQATTSVAFSPDSRTVAAWVRGLTRWDVATGDFVATTEHPEGVPATAGRVGFAFTGPDKIVAVQQWNRVACAWDGVSGRTLSPPPSGHSRPLCAAAFAAGGREVVTGARDEFCRWDAATGAPLDPGFPRTNDFGSPIAFSADGSRGYVTGQVYDLATKRPVGPPVPKARYAGPYDAHFLTPDGSMLALLVRDEKEYKEVRCRVLEVATGKVVTEVPMPPDPRLTHARLTPDGSRLVVGSSSYSSAHDGFRLHVQTWDAKTGAKLGDFAPATNGLLAGLALLDNGRAIFGTGVGELIILDLASGKVERTIDDPERLACQALALSPDGQRVAVVQTTRTGLGPHVRLYDLATGKVSATLGAGALNYSGSQDSNQLSAESVLAFSPDGRRIVTREGPSTALVLDADPAK